MNDIVTSSVNMHNGVPTLFVNGKAVEGAAYITYYTHKNCYDDFATEGYKLFSMPVFFAGRSINAITGIPPFGPGIFDDKDHYNFTVFDNDVKKILDACPDAYIFPRVNMTLPLWWDRENPDEMCDTGFRDEKRVCFSSKKWREETKRLLKEFVSHVEEMPYKNHIIGYQLAGGNTEEWMPFDGKGSIGKRSREAFKEYAAKNNIEENEQEYYAYLSYAVASSICEFTAYVKELTDNRLVMGAFYGYTFELVKRSACHHALQLILDSKSVDFICSPVSYDAIRVPMRDHANMTPIDSLKLHGKLYFVENDTRTDLTGPPNDLPHYSGAIWKGPERSITLEIIKMHFSRALCHGHAFWWFDMWGGWYKAPEYMNLMANVKKVVGESATKPLQSNARVAVFVDETAYRQIPDENEVSQNVCYLIRRELGKMSAPYDVYLITDFEKVKDKYKAIIFLAPARTKAVDEAEKQVAGYLEINETNYGITAEELREFLKKQGVKPYFDKNSVIYENASYLFLHTCEDGEYNFDIPLVDAFTKTAVKKLTLKAGQSVLMEKV
jgi:beta-galactosidase